MAAREKKLTVSDVQKAFNRAIVRRDGRCLVRDGLHTCGGALQCSHFISVGACGALRFYPMNAWTQCAKHHMVHHHRDELFYRDWMEDRHADEFAFLARARFRYVKYTQDILRAIKGFCDADDLAELRDLIRGLLGEE